MLTRLILSLILIVITMGCQYRSPTLAQPMGNKIVIAHRGASGYLPEHTLEAKAMAHAMGADYIEQDVVMTKDDRLVVLHDPFLDRVTNVKSQFPNRFRTIEGQKRWLAMDFTLAEIKTLAVSEGFKPDDEGKIKANYPERFPLFKSAFEVPTLAEEIELIQGLNQSRGRDVGIYVEIKAPWLHRMHGKDISLATLKLLKSYGYDSAKSKAYVQCFDPDETRRIKQDLYPKLAMQLKLVQLIAETSWQETRRLSNGKLENYSYDWLFEPDAMAKVAEYADGIGPWYPMLVAPDSMAEELKILPMVKYARAAGLEIHPFTFRKDQGQIPAYARDFTDFLDIFYRQVGVQGLFTDYPDLAVEYLNTSKPRGGSQ